MITIKIAMMELSKLSLCYQTARYTNDEIEIMAGMWVESFCDISPNVFEEACKLHRNGSQYFPTIKEILDRCKDVWEARQRAIKQIPEPIPDLTPEQIKENADRVRKIIKSHG